MRSITVGDWKRKYFAVLEEIERKEDQWKAIEALLSQAVNRLSLAAQGVDPALDPHLDRLRIALRKGIEKDTLERQVEEISTQVARLAEAERVGQGVDELNRLLERLELPEAQAKRCKALALRLRRADVPSDELIDTLAGQVNQTIRQLKGTATAPLKERLLGRVFQRRCAPRSDPAPRPEVLLAELLGRLELPVLPAVQSEHAALRDRLEGPLSAVQLAAVLADGAALINRSLLRLRQEKEELEAFLQQMFDRLEDLDTFLTLEQQDLLRSREDRLALQEAVATEVTDMNRDVSAATDLAELKRSAQQRLERIMRQMHAYRASEEQRLCQAEARVSALHQQVAGLQQETERLRGMLRENSERLFRDPLTGVFNRLAYDERIRQEFSRWRRFCNPLSLLIWDIDHFKLINDKLGHAGGDQVLQAVAKSLAVKLRSTDFVARYGGEEFVMLLPGANAQAALYVAECIRASIAAGVFQDKDKPVAVTISCGLTEFGPDDSPDTVFERADRALYQAKRNGRDRCIVL